MHDPHSHVPVLLEEVIRVLNPAHGECYADATAGLGGHASEIARRVGKTGCVCLNDADPANLALAERAVRGIHDALLIRTFQGNFADLPRKLAESGQRADMVLADLGFASNQMDNSTRGLSFMREGPLDMRFDPTLRVSAKDIVNSAAETELADLIHEFGEERAARRIARKLVQARARAPISTTTELAELIRDAVGMPRGKMGGIHPATKTFQALRIAVNDELGSLDALLASIVEDARRLSEGVSGSWLMDGARVAVISFHSLEDRAVKRVFGKLIKDRLALDVTGGVVEVTEQEVAVNPRSRSAKLRAVQIGMKASARA